MLGNENSITFTLNATYKARHKPESNVYIKHYDVYFMCYLYDHLVIR